MCYYSRVPVWQTLLKTILQRGCLIWWCPCWRTCLPNCRKFSLCPYTTNIFLLRRGTNANTSSSAYVNRHWCKPSHVGTISNKSEMWWRVPLTWWPLPTFIHPLIEVRCTTQRRKTVRKDRKNGKCLQNHYPVNIWSIKDLIRLINHVCC